MASESKNPGDSSSNDPVSESLLEPGGQRDGQIPAPNDGSSRKSPQKVHLEYERYRGFFQEASDGLARFSKQLKDETNESDGESPLASENLDLALLLAQKVLNKTEQYRETLTGFFKDKSHLEKAMAMLSELRSDQDDVLAFLEHFYDNLEAAEGRTQFEEGFARWYTEDLEPHVQRGSGQPG